MSEKSPLLIGAHMSIAGGVEKAVLKGAKIGATTIQIFTSNQKQWTSKPIAEKNVEFWHAALKETGIKEIMSHNSYLINLGSPKKELRDKSITAFKNELLRCHQLKISYLNFHPGAATGAEEEQCLENIVKSLLSLKSVIGKGKTLLVVEATAGQGTSVGHFFEHLGYIIKQLKGKIPIGVCLDTCHIFAAGYDIRTKAALEETLLQFDEAVGLKHLKAFHLNDSKHDLGSRKDRHASLGKGKIGLDAFKLLMTNKTTKHLPKYLETPLGDQNWEKEIKLLKEFGGEKT